MVGAGKAVGLVVAMMSEELKAIETRMNELGVAMGRIEARLNCQALLGQFLVAKMIEKRRRKHASKNKRKH